ncbi:MAG: F0F1 ATP synthase subunit epsilon [Candidatus Eisenbacteria bacterium]
MAASFHLSVITPTRTLLDEEVTSIVVPGSEGYFGVLAHHAPLIASLAPGKLTVKTEGGQTHVYALSGGFLEVSNNKAILLADAMETLEEIDVERAKKAAERARKRIDEGGKLWDVPRASEALNRALNRMRVHGER